MERPHFFYDFLKYNSVVFVAFEKKEDICCIIKRKKVVGNWDGCLWFLRKRKKEPFVFAYTTHTLPYKIATEKERGV